MLHKNLWFLTNGNNLTKNLEICMLYITEKLQDQVNLNLISHNVAS